MRTDTPGNERFRGIVTAYLMGANAVIAGFDVTRADTLDECDYWVERITRNQPQCVVVAVGNKIDRAEERVISTADAMRHFSTLPAPVRYFETSAKTGDGVQELFEQVAKMALEGSPVDCQNENSNGEPQDEKKDGKCIIC